MPLEVLEYLFQSGVLNSFQPLHLVLINILFTFVFCTRVRQEMLDLRVGDNVFMNDKGGQVVSMGYNPRHALKKTVGVMPPETELLTCSSQLMFCQPRDQRSTSSGSLATLLCSPSHPLL